jgi:YHS domain-containing protein
MYLYYFPAPTEGLEGFCPVTLAESSQWQNGLPKYVAVHQGQRYNFAGPQEFEKFVAAPEKYAPVLRGIDCIELLENNASIPGKRECGVFYNGRIYLFESEANLNKFSQGPDPYERKVSQAESVR